MWRSPSSAGPSPAPSSVAVGDNQLHIGRLHGPADLGSWLAVGDDSVDIDQIAHLGERGTSHLVRVGERGGRHRLAHGRPGKARRLDLVVRESVLGVDSPYRQDGVVHVVARDLLHRQWTDGLEVVAVVLATEQIDLIAPGGELRPIVQLNARVAWGRPITSQAIAQMNPTSSRATAVVTWHFTLPE